MNGRKLPAAIRHAAFPALMGILFLVFSRSEEGIRLRQLGAVILGLAYFILLILSVLRGRAVWVHWRSTGMALQAGLVGRGFFSLLRHGRSASAPSLLSPLLPWLALALLLRGFGGWTLAESALGVLLTLLIAILGLGCGMLGALFEDGQRPSPSVGLFWLILLSVPPLVFSGIQWKAPPPSTLLTWIDTILLRSNPVACLAPGWQQTDGSAVAWMTFLLWASMSLFSMLLLIALFPRRFARGDVA